MARIGEGRGVHRVLVGKPEGKRPLGRPRRRWEYNIRMDLQEVWCRGEVCTVFWLGNLRERDHWGDPDVDGSIILGWIFRKWEGVVGTGWSCLRIGTGGGRLWVR